jgi:hypothetical protein
MVDLPEITEEVIIRSVREYEESHVRVKTSQLITHSTSLLEKLPRPYDYTPRWIHDGNICSLDEVLICAQEELEPLVNLISAPYPELTGKEEQLMRAILLDKTVFWDVEPGQPVYEGKLAMRDWENLTKIAHQLTVQQSLPRGAPYAAHLTLLIHDLVEDSIRHNLLRKLLFDVSLTREEQKFVESHPLIFQKFQTEDKIQAYTSGLNAIIDEAVQLLNLDSDTAYQVRHSLFRMTRPAHIRYGKYIQDFKNESSLPWLFWHHMFKAYDRKDNSHFLPVFTQTAGEDGLFYRDGTKLFADGIKNAGLEERMRDTYLQIRGMLVDKPQEECREGEYSRFEYLQNMFGSPALTNRNMNRLMRWMNFIYGDNEFTVELDGQKTRKSLTELNTYIFHILHDYYQKGGFEYMDEVIAEPTNLFVPQGSLNLFDELLAGKMSFFHLLESDEVQILNLLRGAATVKAMACLNLSYNPFVNRNLIIYPQSNDRYEISTWGRYDPLLNDHQINDYMD